MKPKQFDELIREKLEDVPVNTTDAAVERAFRHVRRNTGGWRFFRLRNLLWLASGMLVIALLLVNWKQMRQNEAMQQQLDSLIARNQNPETQNAPATTEPETPQYANETPTRLPASPSHAEPDQPSGTVSAPRSTTNPATTKATHRAGESNNSNPGIPASPSTVSASEPGSLNTDSLQMVISDSLAQAAILDTTTLVMQDSSSLAGNTSATKPQLRSHRSPQNIRVQAGLDFVFSPRYSGNGVFIALANRHGLGIQGGVNYTFTGRSHFENDQDYHRDKGRDFRHTYTPLLPDTARIADIHARYNVIQIPLRLEYAWSLKNNYALTFGAGTTFDASVREQVEFKHTDPSRYEVQNKNNAPIPHALINSAQLTIGARKDFSRWGLQGNLLLNSYFPGTPYTPERSDKVPVFSVLGDVRLYYRLIK